MCSISYEGIEQLQSLTFIGLVSDTLMKCEDRSADMRQGTRSYVSRKRYACVAAKALPTNQMEFAYMYTVATDDILICNAGRVIIATSRLSSPKRQAELTPLPPGEL